MNGANKGIASGYLCRQSALSASKSMLATPGYWRRTAPGLESLDDADLIRGKILLAFERAEEIAALDRADTEKIRQLLTFVLVGAGTVGVEMASTLAEVQRMA